MSSAELDIVHPLIERYLLDTIPERDDVLAEMEAFAARHKFPIVGPLVGRLLFTLARSINARRIFELGSGFGYSACWFAKATPADTRIICTEGSAANIRRAKGWLERAGLAGKVDFRKGDALEILGTVEGEFDIIFNDIDKHDYPRALTASVPRLRKGGLFVTDNVLWKGRILGDKPDGATAGVLTLNRMLFGTPDLFTTIIPLRDGVSVSIKG